MWIKKIHIENYKSLKEVDIELNEGVNVFIGKNNTGKSSIVDTLIFLSDVVGRGSVTIPHEQYEQIVFGKDIKNKIKFYLEFIVSDAEMEDTFSKLQLEPDISFDIFKESISNKIRYAVKFGDYNRSFTLLEEEVCICFKGKWVVFAKISWNDRMCASQIINLKEGINNGIWNLVTYGGRAPPESVLYAPTSHAPIRSEENLLLSLHKFIISFRKLNPIRISPESMGVFGDAELKSDGGNLPQVLNTIASGDWNLFNAIMSDAVGIVEEIDEIRAPLKEKSSETYLSIVEPSFDDVEFTWEHIASGTKEILYLITLLHTTPNESLLLIEEPEMHLHPDAVHKFLSLVEKISSEDHKQILITTHSPVLLDAISFDKISTVLKESGKTTVEQLKGKQVVEKMLFQAGIPKSWLLLSEMPLFLLIVEGRDDNKIWTRFLQKTGIDLLNRVSVVSPGDSKDRNGGWRKAIEMGTFIKKARISTPFMIVLDSDNKSGRAEKKKELRQDGISTEKYHILDGKEIESYLSDPAIISKTITHKTIDEIKEAINTSNRGGKEKLDDVFLKLGLSKPSAEMKELLVANMAESDIPAEILLIIDKIKTKI